MSRTFEEILREMLEKAPSNVDKRQGSIIYDALAPAAYFLAQQNFQLDNFIDLVFPDTAVGEYLDRAVAAYGVTRKEAVPSIRKMTTSAPVELNSRWGIRELVYAVTEKLEENVYGVTCETAGEIGNQYSGVMQPITNGVAGITATLEDILTPGADEESDEALREKFYAKVRLPATSGNAHHYQLWALEVPGVGGAKVFPLDNGPGTVTVLIVGSDKEIEPSLETSVAEYIEAMRPIGATVTVGSPTAVAINISANVLLDGSRKGEEVKKLFEEAAEEYLRELVFNSSRVSYAQIGRILLETPGVQDYDGLTLNGQMGNVSIGDKEAPSMGTVTISEVSRLGID